ncbi:MAG: prolyl-tRNA synthetase associated domain-containing protein [Pseudomonadota bacterium]
MRGEAGLMADLRDLGIPHQIYEHQAVFTVEESRAIKTDIACLHTKNLFLKDAKGAFFLLTVPAEARIDLKGVPAAIGSKRLSFGKAKDMERLIGIKPGSVTPLAMINAEPGSIKLVLDADLAGDDPVGVHPLRNTATITLAGTSILKLAEHWGHTPRAVAIPKAQPS